MCRFSHANQLDHLIDLFGDFATRNTTNPSVEAHQLAARQVAVEIRCFGQKAHTMPRGHCVAGLAINLALTQRSIE